MINPYLFPSHPDAKDFVTALENYAKDGSLIQFERLSGMDTYTFSGSVVSVIPGEDRVLVRREGREPASYWIRYLFRITDSEGKTTENKAALARHREAQNRREARVADGQRSLVDPNFVPNTRYRTSVFAGKVEGFIDDRACDFFVFKSTNAKPVLSVIYAMDEAAATRCMLLLDAEVSIWNVFASYLQAHFFWPAWLSLREQARAFATELRAGAPVLHPQADRSQRCDREDFYKKHGLTFESWGATASLYSLEGAELDFEALFAFADQVPVSLLNLYLIVAFDSVQFFDQIEQVDADLLQQFIHHGLAVAQPPPTGIEAIETMPITKLRALVKIAGTGFKANRPSKIREHLKTCWSPILECEAVRCAHFKKYQLLPPPGWDWDQFQFFRADYRNMLDALRQWMFNGIVPPKASERFTAIM